MRSRSLHYCKDKAERTSTYAPRFYRHLAITVLSARADAYFVEMGRTYNEILFRERQREVESPGLMGYSTSRLQKVPLILRALAGAKMSTVVKRAQFVR